VGLFFEDISFLIRAFKEKKKLSLKSKREFLYLGKLKKYERSIISIYGNRRNPFRASIRVYNFRAFNKVF